MPFQSDAQRKLLWAKHPAIARRWSNKYGSTPQRNPQPAHEGKMHAIKRRMMQRG